MNNIFDKEISTLMAPPVAMFVVSSWKNLYDIPRNMYWPLTYEPRHDISGQNVWMGRSGEIFEGSPKIICQFDHMIKYSTSKIDENYKARKLGDRDGAEVDTGYILEYSIKQLVVNRFTAQDIDHIMNSTSGSGDKLNLSRRITYLVPNLKWKKSA